MTAVRVLQITDTHLVGDPAGRQRGLVVLDSLRAVLSQALREPTDLILLTGDIVHVHALYTKAHKDGHSSFYQLLFFFG